MPPFNAPSWKQLARSYASDAKFARPTTEAEIAAIEESLTVRLPSDLREFLLEADGFTADYGSRVIWSVRHIHKRDVFRWDHETDGRSWFAGGMEQFLETRFQELRSPENELEYGLTPS